MRLSRADCRRTPDAIVYWIRGAEHTEPIAEGYIGISSIPMFRRYSHLKALARGSHKNPILQNAFNKRGADGVAFEVLFTGPLLECVSIEVRLRPSPEIGWNILAGGGLPPSKAGKKWFTDGKENRTADECPDGFWPGVTQKGRHRLGGRPKSADHRRKLSEANRGRKRPAELVERSAAKRRGVKRPTVQCPHCGKTGGVGSMHQFHLDKCRSRRA